MSRSRNPRTAARARPASKASPSASTGKRRLAIACQGGGSQTAFTAGALRGLFEAGVTDDYDIVSISGTSGGAICAALAWYALRKGDAKPWERLYAFWLDNAATTPRERAFNRSLVQTLRLTNAGQLPSLNVSPSSPWVKMMMALGTRGMRADFTDFRGLIEKHLDFDELRRWGPVDARPVLLMGAVDVLSGRLARFSSRNEPIRVEQILASCTVPDLFAAVEFNGGAYWDGLFSDNPPVSETVQTALVGEENIAQEIWVIKINPTTCAAVPTTPGQISDRRNELIGNGSLFQQIQAIEVLNELYLQGAFNPAFARHYDVDGPVVIPKCFESDPPRPYHIPFIEMSQELSSTLDCESKLDRDLEHIQTMMKDGERQAAAFIAARSGATTHKR